jgi:hypothetical protein
VINDMLDKIYEHNIQNAEFKEDSSVTDSIYVLNNAFTNELFILENILYKSDSHVRLIR